MSTQETSGSGRIVTFYSYKGGTGRTMALANVGWILASAGNRVLLIDWDLEAPGLHRYLHPFLADRELSETPGLIDFFVDFTAAARAATAQDASPGDVPWHETSATLLRYACSVDWEFPSGGVLELVPAGRQDAAYSARVTSFDWQGFYDDMGGGVFLEAVKRQLREEYDYVLIDSRTGISDTSGICTVQMPDDLVVCFTLNQQSLKGAAAVASSAYQQRRRDTGEPSVHIWPVPTRVELAEKERLEAGRDVARRTFGRYLAHLRRDARAAYWGGVEMLYHPYFAYEEILAVFAERKRHSSSLLSSMEALTRFISRDRVSALADMPEADRQEGLQRYSHPARDRSAATPRRMGVFMSYARGTVATASTIVEFLRDHGFDVWWDKDLLPGDNWRSEGESALERSAALVVVFGATEVGPYQRAEIDLALKLRKRVIPVLTRDAQPEMVPPWLTEYLWVDLRGTDVDTALESLLLSLSRMADAQRDRVIDPDDPQRGQWGESPVAHGRRLSAEVRALSEEWFEIDLEVSSVSDHPLAGVVEFHLHPTFVPSIYRVEPSEGSARLTLEAYGAFTVGAVCDGGRTSLELDLSRDERFPDIFRER